jgi:UDPglucose 6-dehydrogenase
MAWSPFQRSNAGISWVQHPGDYANQIPTTPATAPFRALDLDRVKSLLKTPIIVDLRNVYRPADMRKRGFTYASVGRG